MKKINWVEEAEIINSYSDYEVAPTKEGVIDYIEFIISINGGSEYLFDNEKQIINNCEELKGCVEDEFN